MVYLFTEPDLNTGAQDKILEPQKFWARVHLLDSVNHVHGPINYPGNIYFIICTKQVSFSSKLWRFSGAKLGTRETTRRRGDSGEQKQIDGETDNVDGLG